MPMTKEEFLEGFQDLVHDFTSPTSEMFSIVDDIEGEEFQAIKQFDPELGRLFDRFGDAVKDLRTYVISRSESTEKI